MPAPLWDWLALAASLLLVGAYELRQLRAERRDPEAVARGAHSRMRSAWVEALSHTPGMEIVAVQALRNSLMSVTINASTAALALMGSVSLMAGGSETLRADSLGAVSVRGVLDVLLVGALFAAFVCSAMSMRYYNHASYAMSLPVGSAERERRLPMAMHYLQRAGRLYSWGLRCFLLVAPVVAGLIHPLLMPPAAAMLLAVLRGFDQAHVMNPSA